MKHLLLLYTFIIITSTVHSEYTTISTGNDLQGFATEVNSGSKYDGLTVSLANDIDLSSATNFAPIGSNSQFYFLGEFNGNGYLIKNMNLTSSSEVYLSLFGYVNSCIIKNVVIDSSCIITSGSTDPGYVAGIIGYATSGVDKFTLANCVNMATLVGTGPKTRMGGIVAMLYSFSYPATVVNCVNFGDVVYSGEAVSSYVGGIVGWMTGNSDTVSGIYNCVNLGFITATHNRVGSIVGYSSMATNAIQYSYWLNETAPQSYTGVGNESNIEVFYSDLTLSSGNNLVDVLNEYVSKDSNLRKWSTASFNTNGGLSVTPRLIFYVMLGYPDTPEREGYSFDGWYTDSDFNVPFDMKTKYDNSIKNVTIHAKWNVNRYSLIFDLGNGTRVYEIYEYNEVVTYPESVPERIGYVFIGWDKSITNMPAENITIKSLWDEIITEYVEIVFSTKSITEKEIRNIISKFVDNDNYEIKILKTDENGTAVIIKFVDKNDAVEFVEKVSLSSEVDKNIIKTIEFMDENEYNLSGGVLPLLCLLCLIFWF